MLKGVLVGFGIMLAAIPIPIVHFIAVPLSPFVAGFIGSGVSEINEDGIVKFGGLVALLMLIPALAVAIVKFGFGADQIMGMQAMLWFWVMVALIPYTWFGATLGAFGGVLTRRNSGESESTQ